MARRVRKPPSRGEKKSPPPALHSDDQEVEDLRLGEDVAPGVEFDTVEITDSMTAMEYAQQIREGGEPQPPAGSPGEPVPVEVFDEAGYLRLNPDVQRAIELGHIQSGYAHYVMHGIAENRPLPNMPRESRNVMVPSFTGAGRTEAAPLEARCSIDALIIAPNAGLMVVGWIDDASHPLNCIRIIGPNWRVVMDSSRFVRLRRLDVEQAIGSRGVRSFGLLGFLHFDRGGDASGPIRIELWQEGGFSRALQCTPSIIDDVELRDTVLAHLASASFFGNPGIESMSCLGQGFGAELVRFNETITRRIVADPYVERFGPRESTPRGSIVVCLYGKPEYFFLQNCLFAGLPGIEDYEFIYVSNSPEMAEPLLREARCANLMYGLANSVMILPGNAGFGAANNAAAGIARSSRLLVVNPDVFPRDRDWAQKHTDLLAAAPSQQTRLFGVPLYYDDGSLMHGGIYFEVDVGLSMASGRPSPQRICRTQHYGKGAPAESPQFTRPRPVPAVTGAFISIDRSWFEQLGGFTEEFIFGHYEDADLCLKSIEKGTAPWLQDIRMWHLEGKGSTRRLPHEGGSMVNRWLFSHTWMPTIEAGLIGPTPTHPLMEAPFPIGHSTFDSEPAAPKSGRQGRMTR